MKYEELISDLCEVVKESEENALKIYDNCEKISEIVDNSKISFNEKEKIINTISDILGLLQHQDIHRQKIERVVNYVCEKNNIDKREYNLAPTAKSLDAPEEILSEEELELLIRQMQQ